MKVKTAAAVLCLILFSTAAKSDEKLGDKSDGSRAVPVHRINLYDEQGDIIRPDSDPLLPFSPEKTCGQCHSIDKIRTGWHFNMFSDKADSGRAGHPWILTDTLTGTQLPLSYRSWDGLFNPEDVGISRWDFTKLFGRQMPGGIAEPKDPDKISPSARWFESGSLEINCLACHDAHFGHDQSQYAENIAKENFRWAAAATSSFTTIIGAAKDMPDMYDPWMPPEVEDPKKRPPKVIYDKTAFGYEDKILFDIQAKVPNERCYFCHSRFVIEPEETHAEKWISNEDVHIAAGLSCVDCHKNGLDHKIIRGYEVQGSEHSEIVESSTCQGCHIDNEHGNKPIAGRFAAPKPHHEGIPVIHFEKLSCTACHSGPWPGEEPANVKTAIAHGLGNKGVDKSNDALPHIKSPIFAKDPDGKIRPHNLIWPAYWADVADGAVKPILPEKVKQAAGSILNNAKADGSSWPDFSEETVAQVLKALAANKIVSGKPAYIAGGMLYTLKDGKLEGIEDEAAKPYLWPIAHNVRPASQALAVRSCQDCHSTDSGFFFGTVLSDSPLGKGRAAKMVDFEKLDALYTQLFASSFVFRPMLKTILTLTLLLIMLVMLVFAVRAVSFIVEQCSDNIRRNDID